MKTKCPTCKKLIRIPDSLVGKQVLCPNCKTALVALKPGSQKKIRCSITQTKTGFQSRYACPSCKCKLRSGEDEIGKLINCPECQNHFVVPGKHRIENIKTSNRQKKEAARQDAMLYMQRQQELLNLQRQKEAEAREEEARLQAEKAARPFDFPIGYQADANGIVEFRDRYIWVNRNGIQVNPELARYELDLAIKSIRLFKKYVSRTKQEVAVRIKDTRQHFRKNKPTMHKTRRKGLVAGLVNLGIEISREAHAANFENALDPLEAMTEYCNELILACDQLILDLDIRKSEGG